MYVLGLLLQYLRIIISIVDADKIDMGQISWYGVDIEDKHAMAKMLATESTELFFSVSSVADNINNESYDFYNHTFL